MEERLIANIIYRELFSYNTVYLQNIGFLMLVDHPATLSTDGSILNPPYKTVAVCHIDEQLPNSVDVVMAISQSLSVDYAAAYSIYDKYLCKYRASNILSIPYVLQLNLDDMSIISVDNRMRIALEGQQLSPLILRDSEETFQPNQPRRTRLPYGLSPAPSTVQLVFSILAVSAAVLYIVYYYFLKDLL